EKVFARCMQLGMEDGDTRLWHDRAVVYSALQKRVGVSAVAEEVARAMPQQTSLSAAHLPASANPFVDEITRPRSAAAASMPFSEGSAATLRKGSADVLSLSD